MNGLKKRYDAVVFDQFLKPFLIIECKAPYIDLNKKVIEQTMIYNLTLKAELLMITNGIDDLVINSKNEIVELPNYLKL